MAPTKSTIGVLALGIFFHGLLYLGQSDFFVLLELDVRPLSSVLLLVGILSVHGRLVDVSGVWIRPGGGSRVAGGTHVIGSGRRPLTRRVLVRRR
jgi:hypothetical protein